MQEKSILLRFLAVPLGHKLLAVGVAVAIGSGLFVMSRHDPAQPVMPAVMSFDEDAVQQAAPEIARAKEPAVALAQSILTDEALSGLANRPILSVFGKRSDPVRFRSRLLITQPSPKSLQISYRDSNREFSTATANAVANLLVAWKPSPPVAPAPSAPSPETAPPVTEAAAQPHRHRLVVPPATDSLRDLEAQLSAVDKKLAALATESKATAGASNADAASKTMSAEMVQQHLLEMQLAAAQKKLDDLRLRYTDEYPDVEKAKDNVAAIQQELAAAKQPAGGTEKVASRATSGAPAEDASQLRQERGRLTHAIATERRRQAMQRQLAALEAEEPGALVQTAAPPPPQPAPVQALVIAAAPILKNPFKLERQAGSAGASHPDSGSMLRDALAGILCGLLYLGGAMWRYRYVEHALTSTALGISTESSEAEAPKHAEASGHTEAPKHAEASGHAETLGHTEAPKDAEASGHADASGHTDTSTYVGTTWEEEVKRVIAQTDLGRQEEAFLARNSTPADKHSESTAGFQGMLHYNEVSEAIREKIKREPNSWMAHTEEARLALATGDVDTAIKKIELAMTVAPETMKPKLDKIVMQLGRNLKVSN